MAERRLPTAIDTDMVTWLQACWKGDERLRFLVIGGWNTAFGYATFAILYALLHDRLHYLVIGIAAHAVAAVNAFIAHRRLVFRSRGPWLRQFARFNFAQLVVFGSALTGLWVLVGLAGLNPLVAQAIVSTCAVVASYLAHRRFSFTSS